MLFVALRNEAHRFAITYNRKLREKASVECELTKIPGIGKKKQMILMNHFKTMDKIKRASKSDLKSVKGLTETNIESIYSYFNK